MRNAFFRKTAINFFKRGIALLLLIFLGLTVYANPSRAEADTGRLCSKGKVSCSTADCAYSLPSAGNKNVRLAAGGGSAGSKSLIFDDAGNPAGVSRRTEMITAGGKAYAVNQAPSCTYTLQSTNFPAPSAAGMADVKAAVTGDNCPWAAVVSSDASSWLTVVAGETPPFIGTKTLGISYTANTGAARMGRIIIGESLYIVTQAGAACAYTFVPTAFAASSAGGTDGSIAVTANLKDCELGAPSTTDRWIIGLSVQAGSSANLKRVAFKYLANPSALPRMGTIRIGGSSYIVNQAGGQCSYTFEPTAFAANPAGGTDGSITVTANLSDCELAAPSTTDTWITELSVQTGSSANLKRVAFKYAPNPSTSQRTGRISIGGRLYIVNQAGGQCNYTFVPTAFAASSAGGIDGSITVTANLNDCELTAPSTTDRWIIDLSVQAGSSANPKRVAFKYLANPSASQRTGRIRIGGMDYSVTQAGAPCAYTFAPTAFAANPAGGDNGEVTVTALPGDCARDPSTTETWITNLSRASGTGRFTFRYAANPSALPRTGTITIGGISYIVNQAGGQCSYTFVPTAFPANPLGGTDGSIAVTANLNDCELTAPSTTDTWIADLSVQEGSSANLKQVAFKYAPNPSALPRTGTIRIGGRDYSVTQAGGQCSYTFEPIAFAALPAGGDNGSIAVTANLNDCELTAPSTTDTWITDLSVQEGSSANLKRVAFKYAPNPSALPREGRISIGGSLYIVNQAGGQCSYTFEPIAFAALPAGGDNGSIAVTANLKDCELGAPSTTDRWIIGLSVQEGSSANLKQVAFKYAPNPSALPREGRIRIGGSLYIVNQAGGQCSYTFAPTAFAANPLGGTDGSIAVTANLNDCELAVPITTDRWITDLSVQEGSSANLKRVAFKYAPNPSALPREGRIRIGGRDYSVTQAGGQCSYTFEPTAFAASSAGGTDGSITVTANLNDCELAVPITTDRWITDLSVQEGSSANLKQVAFKYAPNPSALPRTGTIRIGGRDYSVTQAGGQCSYTFEPTAFAASSAGGTDGSITVTANLNDCELTAPSTTDRWITELSVQEGSSANLKRVAFKYAPNPSALPREGRIRIGGRDYSVTQAGGQCSYTFEPIAFAALPAGGDNGSIAVTANLNDCELAAPSTTDTWIADLSVQEGSSANLKRVAFKYAPNPSALPREGRIRIGGRDYSVTQAGGQCSYTFEPTAFAASSAGGTDGSITVTANLNDCELTAPITTDRWITDLSVQEGSSANLKQVAFKYAPNPSALPREGRIRIGGSLYIVNQAGGQCSYTFAPTAFAANPLGGTDGSIAVTANLNDCELAVPSTTDRWITDLSVQEGSSANLKRVAFKYAPNPSALPRTGTIRIGGRDYSVTQAGGQCSYTFAPTAFAANPLGGTDGSITVTANLNDCELTAPITTDTWIAELSVQEGSSANLKRVAFKYAPNPSALPRTGTIRIGGRDYSVTQAGGQCSYTFEPTAFAASSAGRTDGSIAVTANLNDCELAVPITTDTWITELSVQEGSSANLKQVAFKYAPNPSALPREGRISIGGSLYIVNQAGGQCSYTFAPTAFAASSAGGTDGSITVTANLNDCELAVPSTTDRWITELSVQAGSSANLKQVAFKYAPNPSALPREGRISIGGSLYIVTQAGGQCSYTFEPTAFAASSAGGTDGSITVTANLNDCELTAPSTTDTWIADLSVQEGSSANLKRVAFKYAPNPSALPRTGTIRIGGRDYSVTQAGGQCSYTFEPIAFAALPAGGDNGSIAVTANLNDCELAAPSTTDTWIADLSVQAGSSANLKRVAFKYAPNPSALPREGRIRIGGSLYIVNQAGGQCSYTFAPTAFAANPLGGTDGSIAVTANLNDCELAVPITTDRWITDLSVQEGSSANLKRVAFKYAPNPSALPREGRIRIGGRDYSVTQAGGQCSYTFEPTAFAASSAGGTDGSITVTANLNDCELAVPITTDRWITDLSVQEGSSANLKQVAFKYAPNPSALPRTGTIRIGGRDYSVTQAGGQCSYTFEPTAFAASSAGGTDGSITVTANLNDCELTAPSTTDRWITELSVQEGSSANLKRVAFKYAPNPSALPREGRIRIGGRDYSVTQAGGQCSYTFEPIAFAALPAGGDNGSIAVTANLNDCELAAPSTTDTWIADLSVQAGSSANLKRVAFKYAPNPSALPREGRIRIGGRDYSVTQAGGQCSYTFEPTAFAASSAGGTDGSITVTANLNDCELTAPITTDRWITDLSVQEGSSANLKQVAFKYAPNPSALPREGRIRIGGRDYSVTQAGGQCNYTFVPTAFPANPLGGTDGSIAVTANLNDCELTAPSTTDRWITELSVQEGSSANLKQVAFKYAPNPSALPREGRIRIGGRDYSVTQAGGQCSYTFAPTAFAANPLGGTDGSIAVTANLNDCELAVPSTTDRWITDLSVQEGSSANLKRVAFKYAPNPSALPRTGTIRIGGRDYSVTQAGGQCSYTFAPTAFAANPLGGTDGSITVTANLNDCELTAPITTDTWITELSVQEGSSANLKRVAFKYAPNPSALPREGRIRIGGRDYSVTQAGGQCSYTFVPTAFPANPLGGTDGSITVTANLNDCELTAPSTTDRWITDLSVQEGSSANLKRVAFKYAPNPSALPREGRISIGGSLYIVNQAGGQCSYTFEPTAFAANPLGGTDGSIAVTANLNDCELTAPITTDRWIAELSVQEGSSANLKRVAFKYAPNPSALPREGRIRIGGRDYSVTQAGGQCSYTFVPTAFPANPLGGTDGSITVTANLNDCELTAPSTTDRWITDLSVQAGSSANLKRVAFKYAPNPSALPREGRISIGGSLYIVNQAGGQCSYTFEPTAFAANPLGGTDGSIAVTANLNDCELAVPSTTDRWIAELSVQEGSSANLKRVAFKYAPNPSALPREGRIRIGGRDYSVTQAGGQCSYTFEPTAFAANPLGGTDGSIAVTANLNDCELTAPITTDRWIAELSVQAGSSANLKQVAFKYAPNPSALPREGRIRIGGRDYSVTQAGGQCSYTFVPTAFPANPLGGTDGSITVTANLNDCELTAPSTTDRWITDLSVQEGSSANLKRVAFKYAPNPSALPREGRISIGGSLYIVNQAGGQCNYTFEPTAFAANPLGGTDGSIAVTANLNDCELTAPSTTDRWITDLSVQEGSSANLKRVAFKYAPNPSALPREGRISIGGSLYIVNQAGGQCNYTFEPTAFAANPLGGTDGSIAVTANLNDCELTAPITTDTWIAELSVQEGSSANLKRVAFKYAPNPSALPREGRIRIGGRDYSVTQAGGQCSYTFVPTAFAANPLGGTDGSIAVTANLNDCELAVPSTTDRWITDLSVQEGSSANLKRVAFKYAPNPSALPREGRIRIGGRDYSVTQAGGQCSYTFVPTAFPANPLGGTDGSITVTANLNDCELAVPSTTDRWIAELSVQEGSSANLKRVAFKYAPNPSALPREGRIRIGGSLYIVNQAGGQCNYTFEPTAFPANPLGGTDGSIAVTANLNDCELAVPSTTDTWITELSVQEGSSANLKRVAFKYAPNPSALPREGRIRIGGSLYIVNQAGGQCSYTFAPTAFAASSAGGTDGSITVTANLNDCELAVPSTTDRWITELSVQTGSSANLKRVAFKYAPNPSALPREGRISIGGSLYIVNQAGGQCSYTFAPTAFPANPLGGTDGSITVTANLNDCELAVPITTDRWITDLSVQAGSSANLKRVAFKYAPNPSALPREGRIRIGGRDYSVTQAGGQCNYTFEPTAFAASSAGGTDGSIAVTANLNDCELAVPSTTDRWITELSVQTGSSANLKRVAFKYAPNPSALPREGRISIGGSLYIVTQAGGQCSYTFEPTAFAASSAGGTDGSITVTANLNDCELAVPSTTDRWITDLSVQTGSSANLKRVTFKYAPNPSALPREGRIRIGGRDYSVTQAGGQCSYTFEPTAFAASSAGGTDGSITVTANLNDCELAVPSTTDRWITDLSVQTGSSANLKRVTFKYTANPSAVQRTGMIRIGGMDYSVTQAGSPCAYTFAPTAFAANPAGGDNGSIAVTANLNDCELAVPSTTDRWITDLSVQAGSSANLKRVAFKYAPNPSVSQRTGRISIGGSLYIVTQAGGQCSYTFAPTAFAASSAGGTNGSITVTANLNDCELTTPSTTDRWITDLSVQTGSSANLKRVTFKYAPNPSAVQRTGTIRIGGSSYIVNQAGATCSYTFVPPSFSATAAAGTGSAEVTASPVDCPWTPSTSDGWITVPAGQPSAASKVFNFSYAANTSGVSRTGTITVGGQSYVVNQDASPDYGCLRNSTAAQAALLPLSFIGNSCTINISAVNCRETNTGGYYRLNLEPDYTYAISGEIYDIYNQNNNGSYTLDGSISYSTDGNAWSTPQDVKFSGAAALGGYPFYVRTAAADGIPGTYAAKIDIIRTANCTYTLSERSKQLTSDAGSGQIDVRASSSCAPWTAVSNKEWLTIASPQSNAGSGSVLYSYAANTSASSRTGTLTIAGQTCTVTQAEHSLSPDRYEPNNTVAQAYLLTPAFTQNAGTVSISPANCDAPNDVDIYKINLGTDSYTVNAVLYSSGDQINNVVCTLDAIISYSTDGVAWSEPAYRQLTNLTARGTLYLKIEPNPEGEQRKGAYVAKIDLLKTMDGCSYSLPVADKQVTQDSGSDRITVTTAASCAWTATSGVAWISLASDKITTGSGSAAYSYDENMALLPRRGTLAIAGQTYTVTQAARPLSPDHYEPNNTAAQAYLLTPVFAQNTGAVSISPANCDNANDMDYYKINLGAGYSYTVNAALYDKRNQINNSNYSLYASISYSADGATWSAEGSELKNLSMKEGTLYIRIKPHDNSAPSESYGFYSVKIGISLTCVYSLAKSSAEVDGGASSATVDITAGASCPWTASSNAAWITGVNPVSGTGNAAVTYSVAKNTVAERQGTLTVAGQTFTVTQSVVAGFETAGTVKIYPNPAKDFVTIDLSSSPENYVSLKIVNIVGQALYEWENPVRKQEVSLKEFSSGLYFILLRGKEGTTVQKLLIE